MSLYGAKIAEHAKHPRNQGSLSRPDASSEGTNPLCGDKLRLELALTGDRIAQVRFRAEACMVSVGAASILSEWLPGMRVAEALALTREALLAALETELRPARLGCASLPLEVLRKALS